MKRLLIFVMIVLSAFLFVSAIEPTKAAKRAYNHHHDAEEAAAEVQIMKTDAQLQKEQEARDHLREIEERERLKNEQITAERKKANLEAAAKAKDPNNVRNMGLSKKIADLEARVKMLEERIQRLESIHPDANQGQ